MVVHLIEDGCDFERKRCVVDEFVVGDVDVFVVAVRTSFL